MKTNKQLLNLLMKLNKCHYIEVEATKEERLVFDNKITFEMFSKDDTLLCPFNDYTYKILHECFNYLINELQHSDKKQSATEFLNNIVETQSFYDDCDSGLIYNSDLLKWLSHHSDHVSYCDEVIEEGLSKGDSLYNIIRIGYWKQKETLYRNAIDILIAWCEE